MASIVNFESFERSRQSAQHSFSASRWYKQIKNSMLSDTKRSKRLSLQSWVIVSSGIYLYS